jgi:hypothetical protein
MKNITDNGNWKIKPCEDDTRTIDVVSQTNKTIATFWRYNNGIEIIPQKEQIANGVLMISSNKLLNYSENLVNTLNEQLTQDSLENEDIAQAMEKLQNLINFLNEQ